MESNLNHSQANDAAVVSTIVGQLKSQGIFDEFRRDCIADFDTKPAYQNLRQRVDIYVSKFLSQQTWCTDLNKNQLRENLRRSINESGMLAWGMDHLVEQVVTPKIYHVFYPRIETIVKEYLGLINTCKEPPQQPLLPLPIKLEDKNSPEAKANEPKNKPKEIEKRPLVLDEAKSISVLTQTPDNQGATVEKMLSSPSGVSSTKLQNETKIDTIFKTDDELSSDSKKTAIENMNSVGIKNDTTNIMDSSGKASIEKKKSSEETKKCSTDKRTDQDITISEKMKSLKDKDVKIKRERTSSECSDKEVQKTVTDKKDQCFKTETPPKKSGFSSAKNEKKFDKYKTGERDKLKSDSAKLKEMKKYDTEKKKSADGKSNLDSSKSKSSKSQENYGKNHKHDYTKIKSSSHKSEEKSKSDVKSTKVVDSKGKMVNKLERNEKCKENKHRGDLKTKSDNEKVKSPSFDLKQKHSTGNQKFSKMKHGEGSSKFHFKSGSSKQISEQKHSEEKVPTVIHKNDFSEKEKYLTLDKRSSEKYKSNEKLDEYLKAECGPESKRLKLDQKTVYTHKKLDVNKSHSKQSDKEKKNNEGKDTRDDDEKNNENPKKFNDKEKIQKEKSIKTGKERYLLKKDLEIRRKHKSDEKKRDSYRVLKDKEKRNERVKELKYEKDLLQTKLNEDENIKVPKSVITDETEASAKVDIDISPEIKKSVEKYDEMQIMSNIHKFHETQMRDYHQIKSQISKESRSSVDSKECETESTCCNFSPEASNESLSSNKGSDFSDSSKPFLGISPTQEESCSELIKVDTDKNSDNFQTCEYENQVEKTEEEEKSFEDMDQQTMDFGIDKPKITQVGIGWEKWPR